MDHLFTIPIYSAVMPIYCSQYHPNPLGSRYCHLCGEQLTENVGLNTPAALDVTSNQTLNLRYRILKQLGHGGFGRTYLAEDLNRFNEPCVLKEFAPQVQGASALNKAIELFEREAGVLYHLQHPQIPRFRELFRVAFQGQDRLFLVQDYVEGSTYRDLLQQRRAQGQVFSESEVLRLFYQLLPVLSYIHGQGVIHRDIAPDNLIQRRCDRLPVLIDFGGVKQAAVNIASQLASSSAQPAATCLGKVGYAPEEQLRTGAVYPHTDLYALAATALALLTGQEPQDLLNPQTLNWEWRRFIMLSPRFAAVLERMLAYHPSDRYSSAQEVLQALQSPPSAYSPSAYSQQQSPRSSVNQVESRSGAGLAASPTMPPENRHRSVTSDLDRQGGGGGWVLLGVILLSILGGSWWGLRHLIDQSKPSGEPSEPVSTPTVTPPAASAGFSDAEQARKRALESRREALGIDYNFFVKLVKQLFYQQHPELNGRQLSLGSEDAALRQEWDVLGDRVLSQLETLSPLARSRLGQYSQADLDQWRQAIAAQNLNPRSLEPMVDARFFALFPDRQGQNARAQPFDQIWYGLARDQQQAIADGTALETLEFPPGAFGTEVSGTLQPGSSKAYIAYLKKGQIARLAHRGDRTAQLFIFPPDRESGSLLKNFTDPTWSQTLPQTGYYTILVIAPSRSLANYQLEISTDNVSTPAEPLPASSPPASDLVDTAPSPAVEVP